MSNERPSVKLIREGSYVADVDVTLIEADHDWAPHVSAADIRKRDDVGLALRRGGINSAARLARVFGIIPVAAA